MSALTTESIYGGFTGRLNASLTAIYRAFRARQNHRADLLALSELDDYLLKDMGINRCEIHHHVYGLHGKRHDDATR